MSHAHLIDIVFIVIILGLFAILPTDVLAAITSTISRLLMDLILDRPYSRMLEIEADESGLQLAAKSCFDVREASVFWNKMSIIEKSQGIQISQDDIEIPVVEFLSTHPSHENRYHHLDSLMDEAIELREKCNCPKLPKYDPRILFENRKKSIAEEFSSLQKRGVLELQKPLKPQNLVPKV